MAPLHPATQDDHEERATRPQRPYRRCWTVRPRHSTQKAIDRALEGDVTALRLCLDRIAPARKDASVSFELPDIETMDDAANAARAILRAVADGEVTPLEAASVMAVVEQFRRTLETTEIERRITALETRA